MSNKETDERSERPVRVTANLGKRALASIARQSNNMMEQIESEGTTPPESTPESAEEDEIDSNESES